MRKFNLGFGWSRLRGLDKASGEWILLMLGAHDIMKIYAKIMAKGEMNCRSLDKRSSFLDNFQRR